MNYDHILIAFVFTFFAGLATGIGALIAFFVKTTNTKFLSVALGFSAGVMIYVSFIEIFPKARDSLMEEYSLKTANWLTILGFFMGVVIIALIDKLIPKNKNPHEIITAEEATIEIAEIKKHKNKHHLLRTGIFTALAIAIHNFPEGFATFMATLENPSLGFAIAVAIAIHNIPEGIAVSVPIYYATGNRKKAFWYSFLSGLAEPLGAAIGFLILLSFMTPFVFGITFASVAGIMVFISLDELLPAAKEYGEAHLSIYGLFAGMLLMAVSLVMLM